MTMKFLPKVIIITVFGTALLSIILRETFDAGSLWGARVLVTGASTGIGEQMAYHYARFGAQIVITARRETVLKQAVNPPIRDLKCLHMAINDVYSVSQSHANLASNMLCLCLLFKLLEVAERCMGLGAQRVLYIPGDMAKLSDPAKVVSFAVDKLGGLDYLVLNHIGSSPFAMWDGDVEHARWLLQVNFLSYLQMTVAALPTLKQSRGAIVVVSSLLGKTCTPFVAPYSATKFAVNGFFGTLRHEFAMQKTNVSLTICTLGLIDTESAMEKVRGHITMTAYSASEAALRIIKAGATRQRDMFYPWYTFYVTLINDWFPYYTDMVIQKSFIYEP